MNETMSSRTDYSDGLVGDLAGIKKTAPAAAAAPVAPAPPTAANQPIASAGDDWKDFDFNAVNLEKPRTTRALPRHEVVRLAVVGFVGGALVWAARLALENWLMRPLFCRTPDTATVCANAGATSFVIALVVVGAVAAALLARQRVFRAVLISVATFVGLGALWTLLDGRSWLVATLLSALFATILYLFFALVAAVKKYALATILLAILVVGFWLLARM